MKKGLFALLVVLCCGVFLFGCGTDETYEIAVVTDVGQLNDGGFNQGTYEGAVKFAEGENATKKQYSYKYYQPANGSDATDNDRIAAMRQAIENGAKIIVTPGFLQATAIETVAKENPEVKFVFIDGWNLGLSNVTAVSYKEQESGYFAGYAAVKDGYTKLAGTFGGDGTNAACNRFAYGYVQGIEAAAAELNTTVDVKLSFQYGASFSASTELQTQISGWYNGGTEVVFSCGGSMLQSVKAAAAETANAKIIGVDVDQAKESEKVITSAVKGLTESVILILKQWEAGEWDTKLADKLSNLGASENATGLPTADSSWRFAKFTKAEYEQLFTKVANGTLTISGEVGENMKTAAAWADIKAGLSHVNLTIE